MATRRLLKNLPRFVVQKKHVDSCFGRSGITRQSQSCRFYTKYSSLFYRTSSKGRSSFLSPSSYPGHHCACKHSSSSTDHREQTDNQEILNPYKLVHAELSALTGDIRQLLHSTKKEIQDITQYYFDGQGKAFRPMVVMLMAKACNVHQEATYRIDSTQHQIAMITEMIHTASLVHDDVIDAADTRRNKASVNHLWGQRKAILAGDFILSIASMALARIRHEEVVIILSQVIEDLVRGEFMQLGSKEDENERFSHYLKKTFKKTASLIANSCKAVAVLGNCHEDIVEMAYQYGRHIGITFQLIDDLLDFVSTEAVLGKPTAADLKLGLATAPVLFAAQEYPELNAMIMRRFCEVGDVEIARHLVAKSEGVRQTKILAERHSQEAIKQIRQLSESPAQKALLRVADLVLKREK